MKRKDIISGALKAAFLIVCAVVVCVLYQIFCSGPHLELSNLSGSRITELTLESGSEKSSSDLSAPGAKANLDSCIAGKAPLVLSFKDQSGLNHSSILDVYLFQGYQANVYFTVLPHFEIQSRIEPWCWVKPNRNSIINF